ncbi:MAG: hypothetical protein AMXMBFR33_39900 [Candidatus Xenobia bacterium]|jgi:dipeptide/tripeptide permease
MQESKDLGLGQSLAILFKASRAFWLVNLVNFVDGIAYFGILTLLTRYLGAELGFSDQQAGVAVSVFTGLVTLTMIGGGFVSDRLGVRRALSVSLLLLLLGRALLSGASELTASHLAAWAALVLMAVGSGVIQPALYAGVKEYTDARTATIGYSLLYSIMNLGIVAENFFSPFVRTSDVFLKFGDTAVHGLGLGIAGVFWFCTALTGLVLLCHLVAFTADLKPFEQRPDDPGHEQPVRVKSPFLDPRFMFFIFILLPVRTLFAHQWLTLPDYVFRCFPESVNSKFEWISGLNPLIIVIFVPLIASMTRNARVLNMMLIGTALSAVTTFMLVPPPQLQLLLLYVAVFSLGEAVWSSRFLEYVANLAPPGKVGSYMGLANIPWFMAKFTTGLYSGYMLNRYIPVDGPRDPSTLWFIYGCIACITPLGLLLARRWLTRGVPSDKKE